MISKEFNASADLLCELSGKETGRSGIAYFVPEQEREYIIEWANEIASYGCVTAHPYFF